MASQMVVPASKDTLFMRGFSSRQNIDTLRDFFTENGGPCTVEFFKESEDQNKLYVALRFDTKDVAKEVLNRYDNKEVLADRITISWFKDLRRARAKGKDMHGGRPYGGRGGWNDRSPENYYGNRSNQYGRGGRNSYGSRDYSNRRERSSSRSRSRSRSYSRERSRSPSPRRNRPRRSRSRSGDSPRNYRRSSSSPVKDHGKDTTPQRAGGNRAPSRFEERSPEGRREFGDDHSVDKAPLSQRSHSPVAQKNKPLRSAVSSVPRSDNDGGDGDRFQEKKPFPEDNFGPADEPPRKAKPSRPSEDFGYMDTGNSFGNRQFQDTKDRSRDRSGMADFPASPPQTKEEYGGFKNEKPDNFAYRQEERRGPPPRDNRDWVQPPRSPPKAMEEQPPRRKRGFEDSFKQEFDGDMKSNKRFHDEVEPPRDMRRGGPEERGRMEKPMGGPRQVMRERSPMDDRQSVSSSQRGERGAMMSSFNGSMSKEVERGALGLPQDKMVMVREKKEEIEKAYRQDCETFAAVTKMLISKDQDLEDKLQHSLRDNLKDIGQRCIHELREFIDKLKTEEGI